MTCFSQLSASLILAVVMTATTGCGTMKGQIATDQLLVSDAVDQSIAKIDFGALSNSRVYLDTAYLKPVRSVGFVNSEYIVSSLRERLVRAHCKLQDKPQDADYVVEVRVGALGTDSHEVNYGIPGSQALNQTASLVSSSPLMPTIPEISLARRAERRAAAKLAVFAYHRESREPVWETGTIQGLSMAKSTWIFGAGPFLEGQIFEDSKITTSPVNVSPGSLAQPVIAFFKRPLNSVPPQTEATTAEATQLTELAESPQLQPVPKPVVIVANQNQQPSLATKRPIQETTSAVVQASATEPLKSNSQFPNSELSFGETESWLHLR